MMKMKRMNQFRQLDRRAACPTFILMAILSIAHADTTNITTRQRVGTNIWTWTETNTTIFSTAPSPVPPTTGQLEEFYGPFASWKTLNAPKDGIGDATAAIQAELNVLGVGNNSPVLWIPAGTYKITQTLKLVARSGVSIIAEDPATTSLIWAGPAGQGTKMMLWDAVAYSVCRRLTFDGAGIVDTLFNYSKFQPQNIDPFPSGSEISDCVFKGAATHITVGNHIAGGTQGTAELLVLRPKFYGASWSAIWLDDQNTCDVWVWYGYFENCAVGVGSRSTQCGGNEQVYRSVFTNSTVADIMWTTGGNYASRWNYSVGSKAHFTMSAGGAHNCLVQGNTIVDATGIPIQIDSGDTAMLLDNAFVGGPVTAAKVNADLIAVGNKSTAAGGPIFITTGRRFEQETLLNVSRASLPGMPVLPATPKKSTRPVAELGPSLAFAATSDSVLHLAFGNYSVFSTFSVPSNVVVVGDGPRSSLNWNGPAGGLVVSATYGQLRDLKIDGNNYSANGVRVTGGRSVLVSLTKFAICTDAAVNVAGGSLEGRGLIHQEGLANGKSGTGVRVTGGRVVINGGASSDQRRYYEISGGELLVRDTWSESHSPLVEAWLSASGGKWSASNNRIALELKITPAVRSTVPGVNAFLLNLVGGPIQTLAGTVVLANNSTAALGPNYIQATTSMHNRSGDPAQPVANAGDVTPAKIIAGLAQERGNPPSDVADLRFYRMQIDHAIVGLRMEP